MFNKKFDVICFGSAVVDAFVQIPVRDKNGMLCIPAGCKMLMDGLAFEIGGGGTNTAVAFSRLGFKTGYIGKVGMDSNGEQILGMLEKERVSFLGKKVEKNTSGFSVVLTGGGRNRSILTYKGINDDVGLEDIKHRGKLKTKWFYFSSLLEKSLKTQIELSRIAKNKGIRVAFNPSEYLIRRNLKDVKTLIKNVDILILNDVEASLLVKQKDVRKRIKMIHEMAVGKSQEDKIIVITNEEKTVFAYDGLRVYKVKPQKTKVVEKTGAGDAFAAGFVASRISGKDIEESIKFANKEAQSVLRHFGAKNDLLKLKDSGLKH